MRFSRQSFLDNSSDCLIFLTKDQLPPDIRGGKAYKRVYRVKAPLEVYWNFKTDFDFLSASLCADYPWGEGMRGFLRYTARWEQEMVFRLKDRYSCKPTE